jgi:hypothetical protein
MKAVFMVPFEILTHQSTILAKEWVHKGHEQGESVIAEVKDTEEVIDAMKADPQYCWLEDIEEVEDAPVK